MSAAVAAASESVPAELDIKYPLRAIAEELFKA